MIYVLGHSRSGSGYMAKLLQAHGLDVGHEKMGRDGISCWAWATRDLDPPWAPGARPFIEADDAVIHHVRDPIKAIPSIAFTEGDPRCEAYRRRYCFIDPLANAWVRATQSWIGWNGLVRALRPTLTVRVEEAEFDLRVFLGGLAPHKEPPPTNDNTRPHETVTWAELETYIPEGLLMVLQQHACWYGYRTED
ncbi:MAG TPA: hypothetical protein VMW94_00800 [Actinomycetes bacterium]|nr:hypothetical protein [Actinomycetes bacterium]